MSDRKRGLENDDTEDQPPCKLIQSWSVRKNTDANITISGSIEKTYCASKTKHIHMVPNNLSYTDPDNPSSLISLRWLKYAKHLFPFSMPESVDQEKTTILHSKLDELSTFFVPVKNQLTKPLKWCSTVDVLSKDTMVKYLQIAFEKNMLDTEGKIALQKLCQEIITILDLDDSTDAIYLASSCGTCRFGSVVDFKFDVLSSSDDGSSSGDSQCTTSKESSPEIDRSANCEQELRKSPRNNSPSTAQNLFQSPSSAINKKKLIPDVIICKNMTLSEPPLVLMVISIKSGFDEGILSQLQLEMASHMVHQKQIFGLQICSASAKLVYMYKSPDLERLYIEEMPSYNFFLPNESDKFQVKNLKKMVDDMICVLNAIDTNS